MAVWSNAMSLRILISSDDSHDGRPLYEVIVLAARDAKLAEAKVVRGITGYGRSRHIHETWRGSSYDAPVVIELIDKKIDAFIPMLERLRAGALVVRQPVQILEVQRVAESVCG